MRKRIISEAPIEAPLSAEQPWLDLEQIAEVEVTSEDPAYPIEGALMGQGSAGWRAGSPGEQSIRLIFQKPQSLRHLQLLFVEDKMARQQEFTLSWSAGEEEPVQEIVRQQYQFNPSGSVQELEDYKVVIDGARMVQLKIIPDRSGGPVRASLTHLRLG